MKNHDIYTIFVKSEFFELELFFLSDSIIDQCLLFIAKMKFIIEFHLILF